jgi:hypothetical protein
MKLVQNYTVEYKIILINLEGTENNGTKGTNENMLKVFIKYFNLRG